MKKKLIQKNMMKENTRRMMLKQKKKLMEMRKNNKRKKIRKTERIAVGSGGADQWWRSTKLVGDRVK